MTVTDKLQSLLAAEGSVPAARIKAPGNWQGLARPYLVHYWTDVRTEDTQDGSADNLRTWEYAVVIAADSHSAGETLFLTLKSALAGNKSGVIIRWTGGQYAGMDDDTGVHEFLLTFRVSETL